MRKINLTKSPESHSPKFDFCCINKCPLSRDFENLKNDSSDPSKKNKEKCTNKKIRREIGKVFGLRFEGLTAREFYGTKRWEDMSPEERESKSKELQDSSPIGLIKKWYSVSPKKKINLQKRGLKRQTPLKNDTDGESVGVEDANC